MKKIVTGILLFVGMMGALTFAQTTYNMPRGVTPTSHDIYWLHMLIFYICVAIGVIVFGVMFYSIIKHRKSRGYQAKIFHESLPIEILWTVIPFIILIGMAIPATVVLVRMDKHEKTDLTIKITGYQWKWRYDYLGEGVGFFSNIATTKDEIHNNLAKGKDYLQSVDQPLVIPIHQRIHFLITANDVIHSWWVPALGGARKDAVPGFINDFWARVNRPGTYYGQCAELCGVNHAYMPIVVKAVSQKEFKTFLARQRGESVNEERAAQKTWTQVQLMPLGEKTYNAYCAACHQPNGMGSPPTYPALKGSKVVSGDVAAVSNIILRGRQGTAMQAFGKQLNAVDLAAVITYVRQRFGDKNDIVQPAAVLKQLKGTPAATTDDNKTKN